MTWYCWATQAIMVIALTARHLKSHGAEHNRSVPTWPVVRSGINDETYRQRIM